jgi:hypothetical protein
VDTVLVHLADTYGTPRTEHASQDWGQALGTAGWCALAGLARRPRDAEHTRPTFSTDTVENLGLVSARGAGGAARRGWPFGHRSPTLQVRLHGCRGER